MKLPSNTFKKTLACFCLCLYVLLGFLSTNSVSVCYGSEHSEHIGINIFGYEPCCDKEEITAQIANLQQYPQASYQSKCNCVDYQLTGDNQLQQISTNNINIADNLFMASNINTQISPLVKHFEEKYNKINWDIYGQKKFDNHLAVLNTVILLI